MQPSGPEDENGYERVLAREDRSNARAWLIIATMIGLALSSFLNTVAALIGVIPIMLFNTAMYGWHAYQMIRTGYVLRGKAMMGNLWRTLAVTLILGVIFWIQARYGLWFAQYMRDGFY